MAERERDDGSGEEDSSVHLWKRENHGSGEEEQVRQLERERERHKKRENVRYKENVREIERERRTFEQNSGGSGGGETKTKTV